MATQGEYLVPRSHTPVFEEEYHETFAERLDRAFRRYEFGQRLRRARYHEAADESPAGFTPPEVKERRRAELKAIDEMWKKVDRESGDWDSSDGDEGDDATPDGKACVERVQSATEWPTLTRSQEAHGLPTPSLSPHSSPQTPLGRKRRCDEEEKKGEEPPKEKEEEPARKTRIISAARLDVPEGEKPDGSQVKGRKRRRADDVDDEWEGEGNGERDMERPVKACKTTPAPTPQQMRRPPK